MSQLIEDALANHLAQWIVSNRPPGLPAEMPVHIAGRDELCTRPCIVRETSTVPDETRGRETVLSFEAAVVTAG